MQQLVEQLKTFANNFLDDKQVHEKASKNNPSWNRLVELLPIDIAAKAHLGNAYLVEGSIGAGNLAEVPWICIFDRDITTSAQNGYYIVLLFRSDMEGVYLSLNQGWTQYQNAYGTKVGKETIVLNAEKACQILRSVDDYIVGPIDLNAHKSLGKGYELGNICSCYYPFDGTLSDDTFLNDLRNMLGIYKELKGLVGTSILDIDSVASEEDYQSTTQKVTPKQLPEGPVSKKDAKYNSTTKKYYRDPSVAKDAIEKANYLCSIDSSHHTFTSAATGKPFVEAHHIIPMEFQEQFEYSLDVPENIVALCPNCHRQIHQAIFEEKDELIKFLYQDRQKVLEKRGLPIDLSQLETMYKK